MRLRVDNRPITPTEITYNDGLGYGRFDGVSQVHTYSLFVPKDDLIHKLGNIYREAVEEIGRDDELVNGSSSFKKMGYVGLSEAFAHPALLAEAIETYFDRDIFNIYLPESESFLYVINSTERVTVSADGVLLEGRCFGRRAF